MTVLKKLNDEIKDQAVKCDDVGRMNELAGSPWCVGQLGPTSNWLFCCDFVASAGFEVIA